MTEHNGATKVAEADDQIDSVSVRTETDGRNTLVRVYATATTNDGAELKYRFMPRTNATVSEPRTLAIKTAKKYVKDSEWPSRLNLTVPPEVKAAVNERGFSLA